MSVGCSGKWVGVASVPRPGLSSATSQPFGVGSSTLGRALKKALNEDRTVVFIDESGLSQKPHRVRTWAPCGKTPVLEFDFNWKKLSVIGGITVLNFYFQFYPGTIKSPQVIEFLKHLQQHLPGKLLMVWDGAMIHRRRLVRAYLESLHGRLYATALPAYPKRQ